MTSGVDRHSYYKEEFDAEVYFKHGGNHARSRTIDIETEKTDFETLGRGHAIFIVQSKNDRKNLASANTSCNQPFPRNERRRFSKAF